MFYKISGRDFLINAKLRAIRNHLNFSQTMLSKYFNISSYKYKRLEEDDADVAVDLLLLISVMLRIPLDYLMLDEYSVQDVLELPLMREAAAADEAEKIRLIEKNLCDNCTSKYNTVTCRVINNITRQKKEIFIENLCELSSQKNVDPFEIEKILNLKSSEYNKYTKLPSVQAIICAARLLDASIQSLFEKKE